MHTQGRNSAERRDFDVSKIEAVKTVCLKFEKTFMQMTQNIISL